MNMNRMNRAVVDAKRSAIRRFSRMARETPGSVALTLGEPDFDTPLPIRAAAKQALDLGDTHYIENNGTAALRAAIAEYERVQNGMDYAPEEVIVTVGATEALFCALFGVLEPGDEVIVPTPAFGLYESIIGLCRGTFVPLDTTATGFQIDEAALNRAITPRTKAIVLNSPNNPTGCVLTRGSLEAVRRAAEEHDLFVICDDVYRRLVYTPDYHSFAEYRSLRDRIIVVQSFSKPWAMTGWRVGWLLADAPVVEQLGKVHQFCVVSAPSTAQRACVEALACDPAPMREVYRRRRDKVLSELEAMGVAPQRPDGAFYVFAPIGRFGLDSETFCTRMLREAGLAATPGFCFGSDAHIRLSYCYSDAQLDEAFARMKRFLQILAEEGRG